VTRHGTSLVDPVEVRTFGDTQVPRDPRVETRIRDDAGIGGVYGFVVASMTRPACWSIGIDCCPI
jgi:hypothetical protein